MAGQIALHDWDWGEGFGPWDEMSNTRRLTSAEGSLRCSGLMLVEYKAPVRVQRRRSSAGAKM